jgi:hypothetical protein
VCIQIHGAYENNNTKYIQINRNEKITNDIKCHCGINAIYMNKNTQIKINKNNNDEGACSQVCNTSRIRKNKYIQIKNKKRMTNDTKCHFETNVININKNIKTTIDKDIKDRGICVQTCSILKKKKNKVSEIKYNKKVTNDTKCHFVTNIIFINKNIEKIKMNKNLNNICIGIYVYMHIVYK